MIDSGSAREWERRTARRLAPADRSLRGRIIPVTDPSLLAELRRTPTPPDSRPMHPAAKTGCLGSTAFGFICLIAAIWLSPWWIVGLFLSATAGIAVLVADQAAGVARMRSERELADRRTLALRRERTIDASSLDTSSCELLIRAQQAIGAILGSEVYGADLLDGAAGEAVLRRHEWDIATALRDITRLGAEHQRASGTRDGGPGPMTTAVLDSHKRALSLARDAVTSRVSSVERYAGRVKAADAAQLDWRSAQRASDLNGQYLDLVARTTADKQAIAEITELTEQAAAAERVFRDSLHQAVLAAEALFLPAAQD